MKRLGERIKRRRESLHLQLNDLAKQVGISASALSQIENAKAFPSIFHLKTIADRLHTTVGEIIGEHETVTRNPIIKSTERKFVKANNTGTRLYLLSHPDPIKKMETYAMEFIMHSDAKDIMTKHPGHSFIYLTNGAVNIQLEENSYDLLIGDSFYFYSNNHHEVININSGISELIWVLTS
jgi:transcriptional regulator with XRE-family HTH domain